MTKRSPDITSEVRKFVPKSVPETALFWEKADRKELWIQRCLGCQLNIFYPRVMCPRCSSTQLEWFQASGRATLYSYIVNARPAPGWESDAPYIIAVVELEEGPRMMTNIVGVDSDPTALELDAPLTVDFEAREDKMIPVFRLHKETK